MKTPEQIAQQVIENFDADNQTPEGERVGFGILVDEDLVTWMIDAIEADRAQRRIPFDTLDHMLNAWGSYDGDVSGFIEAWADYFNEGTEVPDWAKA